MKYLLEWGEFNNKGSEAMTLIALDHIYRNDINATVYMLHTGVKQPFQLKKNIIYIPNAAWWVRERIGRKPLGYHLERCKDIIKYFIPGKFSYVGKKKLSGNLLRSIDVVVDVSGFALSSKWGDEGAYEWLDQLNLMQSYGAKVYLMPQSFGPFDFADNGIIEYGREVLSKCELIYAREKTGCELLKSIGLSNVEYMPDSVLIEKNFKPSRVVKNIGKYREEILTKSQNNICIIPNFRLVDYGGMNMEILLKFYIDIIEKHKDSFDIFLIAHAGEDLAICKAIKENYLDDDKVILVDHVLYSFNYEEFVKKVDFIIASRYHAIIHAYKEYVPAVIFGWADKYHGVAEVVNQTEYIICLEELENATKIVEKMANSYSIEKEIIKQRVIEVQKNDCYAFLKDIYEDR